MHYLAAAFLWPRMGGGGVAFWLAELTGQEEAEDVYRSPLATRVGFVLVRVRFWRQVKFLAG
jgi:hypothetical protein